MEEMEMQIQMAKEADEDDYLVGEPTTEDFIHALAFNEKRHTEKIEALKTVTQTWRMKERVCHQLVDMSPENVRAAIRAQEQVKYLWKMKTVSVALVMCLNVGVDPPDVIKTSPCARQECWIDPLTTNNQKALEAIGANLQRQYERWQPKARYKQSLDPTAEEVKKLCTSLRRNAKEERVLFHYNGHGVPRPTANGEVWVFNKSYTQYIPLSVYDLQTWMGSPSIYVYDCSSAGIILESFKQFSNQREEEIELSALERQRFTTNGAMPPTLSVKNCIQLASCGANELLPMNPELPADLFTACLTTPIKVALKWFVLQNTSKLVPNITMEIIDKIPGQLNDRRTMLGELNWIFTAITDTIAWNTLPRELFQRLFRQDLLVASLFRNFLLAERVMRSNNCAPVSSPKLPHTHQHPMWNAWDLALDLCLSQLHGILDKGKTFQHSPFFAEQLTAFQVWLSYGTEKRTPPEQLPIVLQVLLSQVHRLRALDLLGRFLDLGPWAVSLALSVGIFPYVLKLLQSTARELRPLLVFIWAKILAVDSSCQADLVKDNGHKYFLSVLSDQYMPAEHRTMAAFVLAMIVNNYPNGQEAALQGNLIAICLEQLDDPHDLLRQWLALCLGKMWCFFDAARWCGVRDSAHEKLYKLLTDENPEVRAAAVYALGTFINNSSERNDHANNIDHGVGMTLLNNVNDGSPLVRKELIVSLASLVRQFEVQFSSVASKHLEEEKQQMNSNPVITGVTAGSPKVGNLSSRRASDTSAFSALQNAAANASGMKRSLSSRSLRGMLPSQAPTTSSFLSPAPQPNDDMSPMKRVSSSSSISSLFSTSYGNIFLNTWRALLQLSADPNPEVADMAKTVVNSIKVKAAASSVPRRMSHHQNSASHSAPSSPSNKPNLDIVYARDAQPGRGSVSPPRNVNQHNASGDKGRIPRSASASVLSGGKYSAEAPGSKGAGAASPGGVPFSTQFRSRKMFDRGPTVIEEQDEDDSSEGGAIVRTELFEWCCRYFSRPVMRVPEEKDPESGAHQEHEFQLVRAARVKHSAMLEQNRTGFNRLDSLVFIDRNITAPSVLRFHPYDPYLAVAEKESVSIWNWEEGVRLNVFENYNPPTTRLTAMEFLNAHDTSLLLVGSDDGAVRVWRHYENAAHRPPSLITSWQALNDMLPSSKASGMVLEWKQNSGLLFATGDVRTIRVWDVHQEVKIQDIPTGAGSCVTSVRAESEGAAVLLAGCGDGSVRLYDRRLSPSECRVATMREHSSWVVNLHQPPGSVEHPMSASTDGDIKVWDLRMCESVRTMNHGGGLTAFEVHPYADLLACGSMNQWINVGTITGDILSLIRYHEGFMGQRIGPVSCMSFHPYKIKLAAGSSDSFISVYSSPEHRRR